jgi:hypothetical protein
MFAHDEFIVVNIRMVLLEYLRSVSVAAKMIRSSGIVCRVYDVVAEKAEVEKVEEMEI